MLSFEKKIISCLVELEYLEATLQRKLELGLFDLEKEYSKKKKLFLNLKGKLVSFEKAKLKKVKVQQKKQKKQKTFSFKQKYGCIFFKINQKKAFVGRNQKKNASLYKQFSHSEGFFFHVQKVSGAAVFFLSPSLDEEEKLLLADLANVYSKNFIYGRLGLVEFCEIKNVSSPSLGRFILKQKSEIRAKKLMLSFDLTDKTLILLSKGPCTLLPGFKTKEQVLKENPFFESKKLIQLLPSGKIELSMPEFASGS